jgi:hypothetical protein
LIIICTSGKCTDNKQGEQMRLKDFLGGIKNRICKINNEDQRATVGTRDLVSILIFCFSRDRGDSRTLDGIRTFVQSSLDVVISRGGFWERLATRKLEKIFEGLVSAMIQNCSSKLLIASELLKVLNVGAILLLDSSSSSLPKAAKKKFPAPRKNVVPAAIKLHLCFDLFGGVVSWFKLTAATTHDRKGFPPIQSLIGKLIIFDLGYWDYQLLADIKNIGGYFLTRVKTNATICISKVIAGLPKKDFEGRYLLDCKLPKVKETIVEVIGEFSKNGKLILATRIIGFWNPIDRQYHWYATNLGAPAKLIYPLYRLRWQIELIFKSFKSCMRLADLPTANTRIILTLMYAALVATMIAHPIANILAMEFKQNKQMSPSFQRAGMLVVRNAKQFIEFLISKSGSALDTLIRKLMLQKKELFDPNWNKRETSAARLFRLILKYV